MFNRHADKLYGHSYDFAYFIISDFDFKSTECSERIVDFVLDENSVETIVIELGEAWLQYQFELQIEKQRVSRLRMGSNDDYKKLSFEERTSHCRTLGKIDFLLNRHDKVFDSLEADKMEKLGEVEYTKKEKEKNDFMLKLLNKI